MKGKKSLSQDEEGEGEEGKTGHGDRASGGLRGGEIAPAYSTPKRSDDENISFNLEVKKPIFFCGRMAFRRRSGSQGSVGGEEE